MIRENQLSSGMEVTVSDGTPEPDRDTKLRAWNIWASHNFTGTITDLNDTHILVEDSNGTVWSLTRGLHTFTPTNPSNELLDQILHEKIDYEAGEFRKRFITSVPGQSETYELKKEEAQTWLAATDPDPANFPFLSGEASVRGITVEAMADMVMETFLQWKAMGALIEVQRIGAKEAVSAAITREDKEEAAAVDWESLLA